MTSTFAFTFLYVRMLSLNLEYVYFAVTVDSLISHALR